MAALKSINPAGWTFVWPERSNFIEVFRDDDPLDNAPFEVLEASDLSYTQENLNRLANEDPHYSRMV